MRKDRTRYHHGALRQAAIEAAMIELDRSGPDRFTLDGLARSLGVTPPALYRHFADRRDLLAAVIEHGFARFVAELDEVATGSTEPADVLRAIGRFYVRFAVKNPGWFRLQFSQTGLQVGGDRADMEAPKYFFALQGAVAALTGWEGEAVMRGYLLVWATVQGLATLVIEGMLGPSDEERLAHADAVVDTLIERLAARSAPR